MPLSICSGNSWMAMPMNSWPTTSRFGSVRGLAMNSTLLSTRARVRYRERERQSAGRALGVLTDRRQDVAIAVTLHGIGEVLEKVQPRRQARRDCHRLQVRRTVTRKHEPSNVPAIAADHCGPRHIEANIRFLGCPLVGVRSAACSAMRRRCTSNFQVGRRESPGDSLASTE